ncbi:MAG: PAS domain S-box protein [Candidatus Aureabacteria bacterium]|nr:PAS domain S-box protein [Candidatus Auribacterota bacterium]
MGVKESILTIGNNESARRKRMKDSGKAKTQLMREVRALRRRLVKLEASERELRLDEELFRRLIQTIPDIIYMLDSHGRFVFVNEAIRQLGYEPNRLIGKCFGYVLHPDDVKVLSRLKVLPKYKGRMTGDAGSPKLFDERRTGKRCTRNLEARILVRGKGRTLADYHPAEIHSCGEWLRNVKDENKKLLGSIGIIRDITERKKAEEEIARLASFPEQNPNPVCEADLDGRILYANPAARRFFPELRAAGVKHPWLVDFCSVVIPNVTRAERHFFVREIKIDDTCYEQTIHYITDPPRIRIYGRDITHRKRVEEAEQLERLSNRLLEFQEEERKRVARGLHDGIGQVLTAIKLSLGMIKKDHPEFDGAVHRELGEVVQLLDAAMDDVRRISNRLRPATLDSFGLIPCIEHEINFIASRSGIAIKFTWEDLKCKLTHQKEIALYRVTQEALTNIIRHANVTHAEVSFNQKGDKVCLKIRDKGRGFDMSQVKKPQRLGLLGMKERIVSVGGTLRISSHPGQGTVLEAEVPS